MKWLRILQKFKLDWNSFAKNLKYYNEKEKYVSIYCNRRLEPLTGEQE